MTGGTVKCWFAGREWLSNAVPNTCILAHLASRANHAVKGHSRTCIGLDWHRRDRRQSSRRSGDLGRTDRECRVPSLSGREARS
jgi:hypothetical protein